MNSERLTTFLTLVSDPNQVANRNNSLLLWVNSGFFDEISALGLRLAAQNPTDQPNV